MTSTLPTSLDLTKSIKFAQLSAAVRSGNVTRVLAYLSNKNCQTRDPLADQGYPDEDGYNTTVVNSLLYEAVPHFEVLKILLEDGRFDPNDNNKDAFYRCLLAGNIQGLKLFYDQPNFTFPDDTLTKVAELGGRQVIKFLLHLDELSDYSLFSQDDKVNALDKARESHDQLITTMLQENIDIAYRPAFGL
ncbi:Uncharacterised protein [Legionella beliardensis]|uniref:Ankyrin repeats (3 copies) n=1 Tax=Legionella beliardensis TaxID=91822 RepID=A0A378I399_9GAMM|nr:hypothetical protein [Legionella beliardensis]STX29171.1 Uncharacterised protein [Legionella beliardensis]